MTAAFQSFMKQYHATGSEKADGYSRDVFVGLDELEKEQVFKLLTTELPFSAEWLFLVDAAKATSIVKQEEQKMRGDGYRHTYMLQEQLIRHTGDPVYQQHMIEDYPAYIDDLKPLVIDAIGRSPANDAVLGFLKQVILVETDESAVARAARRFLIAANVPRDTEAQEARYRHLMEQLRSDNPRFKLRAIDQIEQSYLNSVDDGD
jgi:hypothetical protein